MHNAFLGKTGGFRQAHQLLLCYPLSGTLVIPVYIMLVEVCHHAVHINCYSLFCHIVLFDAKLCNIPEINVMKMAIFYIILHKTANMLREERLDYILKKLKADHKVLQTELSTDLQVSEDTVRRDLESLAQDGL